MDVLREPIDELYEDSIGYTDVLLDGERGDVRNNETNLGDLMCNALLWQVAAKTGLFASYPDAPAACLFNGGTIRCGAPRRCALLSCVGCAVDAQCVAARLWFRAIVPRQAPTC